MPVREFKSGRVTGSAEAYTYLRMASYVKLEGNEPTNITGVAGLSDSCESPEEDEQISGGLTYYA